MNAQNSKKAPKSEGKIKEGAFFTSVSDVKKAPCSRLRAQCPALL